MRKTVISGGLELGTIGFGCTSMSANYYPGNQDDRESIRVIHRAVELGIRLFDTADVYGPFSNEELLGRALRGRRERAVIATKCGLVPDPDGGLRRNGRPEHIRKACTDSLTRLRTDVIDLYQLHRVDPGVPLEYTWGAMAQLVQEGKVRGLGISHARVDELDLVHSIFPVTAVQYELSVLASDSRGTALPWSQDNGVAFIAFSPMGRGFLTGTVDGTTISPDDSRSRDPRFTAEAMSANQVIVRCLKSIAARHGVTPAQAALAWVMAQGSQVVPIPGTRSGQRLAENVAAAAVELDAEDLRAIARLPAPTGKKRWDVRPAAVPPARHPGRDARPAAGTARLPSLELDQVTMTVTDTARIICSEQPGVSAPRLIRDLDSFTFVQVVLELENIYDIKLLKSLDTFTGEVFQDLAEVIVARKRDMAGASS